MFGHSVPGVVEFEEDSYTQEGRVLFDQFSQLCLNFVAQQTSSL